MDLLGWKPSTQSLYSLPDLSQHFRLISLGIHISHICVYQSITSQCLSTNPRHLTVMIIGARMTIYLWYDVWGKKLEEQVRICHGPFAFGIMNKSFKRCKDTTFLTHGAVITNHTIHVRKGTTSTVNFICLSRTVDISRHKLHLETKVCELER